MLATWAALHLRNTIVLLWTLKAPTKKWQQNINEKMEDIQHCLLFFVNMLLFIPQIKQAFCLRNGLNLHRERWPYHCKEVTITYTTGLLWVKLPLYGTYSFCCFPKRRYHSKLLTMDMQKKKKKMRTVPDQTEPHSTNRPSLEIITDPSIAVEVF